MNKKAKENLGTSKINEKIRGITKKPHFSILIILVFLIVMLSMTTEAFFSWNNFINIIRQTSSHYIVAIGMTFVLILGGIDLSVGSIACLTGTITAGLLVRSMLPTVWALLIGLLIGIVAGLINGIIIARLRIPAFIATLAMMSTARGLSLLYSGGYPITNFPDDALFIGRGQILGIPVSFIIMIVIVILAWILLYSTRLGRHIYAIGANEECARMSGIRINIVKITVYAISGLTAAITGIILTMRLSSSQPTLGEGMELDAITAVVLGGTSLFGGRGYIFGTILGAVFMTILGNGLNILGVNAFWQQIVNGVILVIAVSLYERGKNAKEHQNY